LPGKPCSIWATAPTWIGEAFNVIAVAKRKPQRMSVLPRVSIITPSYNQGRFLEECIQSVLNQDYPNIEYIIVDGGSTDSSVGIIRKYADRLAYWVSEPDSGQSAAISKGLRRATGDIWAWMNADDSYLPGAVSKAAAWFADHPEDDVVYGDCMIVDEHGREKAVFHAREFEWPRVLTKGFGIPTGSTFLRMSVFERVGRLDESLHYVMDVDYWLRAGQSCVLAHIPQTLSHYRVHPSAKTFDVANSETRAREFVQVYERFWHRDDLPQAILAFRSRSLAHIYLYAAHLAGEADRRDLCLRYLRKSLGMGLVALRPRLARLLIYVMFGRGAANFLQKIRSSRLQA
jgi:glycosyltransferase involved in cell wall biosynthesis